MLGPGAALACVHAHRIVRVKCQKGPCVPQRRRRPKSSLRPEECGPMGRFPRLGKQPYQQAIAPEHVENWKLIWPRVEGGSRP